MLQDSVYLDRNFQQYITESFPVLSEKLKAKVFDSKAGGHEEIISYT